MNENLFAEVRAWVRRNARELEWSLWRRLFEGGDAQAVLDALSAYQNEDGGFGHALEADSWNPASTPYTTMHALGLLQTAGILDHDNAAFQGACRYLNSGAETTEHGWRFAIPSNNDYPHAPWWGFDPAASEVENIGLTAGIAAFALTQLDADAPAYQRALRYGAAIAKRLESESDFGEMGVGGLIGLIPALRSQNVAGLDYELLNARVRELVNRSIVRDPAKWPFYGVRPSRYIQSPQSPYYQENADIVAKEVEYTLAEREPGGVWGITWSWFDLGDQYAKAFAISENWWKSQKAIENMLFLRAFGAVKR